MNPAANHDKAILTCALAGVLTEPRQHPVPVAPAQMAAEARDAFNAGSLNHLKIREDRRWAWPPRVFDNPVAKIKQMIEGRAGLAMSAPALR